MTLTNEELLARLDEIADVPRTIKIDEARKRWRLASKSAALYVLRLMEDRGLVRRVLVGNGTKGEWIVNERRNND